MKLKKIESAPLNTPILLYWNKLDHFEKGRLYLDFDAQELHHVLSLDGDEMDDMPSHWCNLPSLEG